MERQHIADREAYKHYVGEILPRHFIMGHASINAAIDYFLKHWQHDEPVPDWLDAALFRYIEDSLESVPVTRHFEYLTDNEQEKALHGLLQRMTPEQLQKAYQLILEAVEAEKEQVTVTFDLFDHLDAEGCPN